MHKRKAHKRRHLHFLYTLTHPYVRGCHETHTFNTQAHAPDKRCLSHLLSFHPPPSQRFLSFPTDSPRLPLPSPFFSSLPLSSLSEISEKIAEGQIRGWLPLCVTSKDKYSQDDSNCLEDVYVCTCMPPLTPPSPLHPTPPCTHTRTCASLNTHTHCCISALSCVTQ